MEDFYIGVRVAFVQSLSCWQETHLDSRVWNFFSQPLRAHGIEIPVDL